MKKDLESVLINLSDLARSKIVTLLDTGNESIGKEEPSALAGQPNQEKITIG